jgi:hypothetical protein
MKSDKANTSYSKAYTPEGMTTSSMMSLYLKQLALAEIIGNHNAGWQPGR